MNEQAQQERLRLRAESADDLATISALVQDMALVANDIAFDARRRRLVIMGNRFRWEAAATPSRIRSALRFDCVERVQHKAMPADPTTVLALLAVTGEAGDMLNIAFANGTTLRLKVEALDVTLEDVAGPWGAKSVPAHGD